MERVESVFSSISDKYPTYRDTLLKVPHRWLDGKRVDDNAEGVWRVHDKLYDLKDFIKNHPGGGDWLSLTKGTDITEQFESHHITGRAEQVLKQFYVRDASEKRNYKFTYHNDGFYRTLKRRAADLLPELDYTPKKTSEIISDLMLALIFMTSILAAKDNNIYMAVLAGAFINAQLVIAHNFFHRKDNWRMLAFNLTLLTAREWRISHAMSHHMYTNSYYDLEISMFEPHLQWIPRPKTLKQKILSCIVSPVVWITIPLASLVYRTIGYFAKVVEFRFEDLIAYSLPIAMYYLGRDDFLLVIKLWSVSIATMGFLLGLIGLNAGHHHPNVAHEGDELPKGMDFGIFQMNAVIDRRDVKSSQFMTLVTFGHHTLHHLFPTLDHGLLPQLHGVFLETCKEFEVELREYPWWPLIKGQFYQLVRDKPKSLKQMKLKDI